MKVFITMRSLLILTVFPPDFNTTLADSPVIGIRLFNTSQHETPFATHFKFAQQSGFLHF